MNRKKKPLSMAKCRAHLAALWFIGAVVISSLLFLQTIFGKYDYKVRTQEDNVWMVKVDNKAIEAWEWFLPIVTPTLSLILSVWAFSPKEGGTKKKKKKGKKKKIKVKEIKKKEVSRFMYNLSFYISLVHLTAVSLVILLSPFFSQSQLALMKLSQIWLGAFEGLVSISLGAFFVHRIKIVQKILEKIHFI